jgi:integrase
MKTIEWPKNRRVELTEKGVLKIARTPAEPGERYKVMDELVTGFGIRVTDKSHASYILAGRFPGSRNFTRREIGVVSAITLAEARAKARKWKELIQHGKDPRDEEERAKREQARKTAHTFAAVAEDYIAYRVIGPKPEQPIQRKWKWVARTVRDPFIEAWGERPIADIGRDDVLRLIREKKKTAPGSAREQLAIIKSLFAWALDQSYGLERSVCSDIKPKSVIGEKNLRERALSDDEVRALWAVAEATSYPIGPIYKMLLLSGLRLNEVADASWSEFDLAKREWLIPSARMKGRNAGAGGKKARAHLVPLTPAMIEILDQLPRFKDSELLFSTTHGKKPVWLGTKVKAAVDAGMLKQLQDIAKERGNNPRKVELEAWVNHDIRRSVRTNLSALKVREEVGEAILAHAKVGIVGVYNVHGYADEKREALELWAARLREIVTPPQPEPDADNIVRLRKA